MKTPHQSKRVSTFAWLWAIGSILLLVFPVYAQFKAGQIHLPGSGGTPTASYRIFAKQISTTGPAFEAEAPSTSDRLKIRLDGTSIFFESTGDSFRIDGADVGIGHAPVSGKLDVKGTAIWFEHASTDHAVRILPGTTGGSHLIEANFVSAGAVLPIRISANAGTHANQLYLDTIGRIGIGASPSHAIDLSRDGSNAALVSRINNTGTATNDDVILAFTTQGSRNTSQGIDRSTTLYTIAGANASLTSNIGFTMDPLNGDVDLPAGAKIGSGAEITAHLSGTASLDFTALAANTCETFTITVTGALDGNTVTLGVPNALADVDGATERTTFYGWVSASDTVSVRRCNVTGTVTAEPSAATVRADVWKH